MTLVGASGKPQRWFSRFGQLWFSILRVSSLGVRFNDLLIWSFHQRKHFSSPHTVLVVLTIQSRFGVGEAEWEDSPILLAGVLALAFVSAPRWLNLVHNLMHSSTLLPPSLANQD